MTSARFEKALITARPRSGVALIMMMICLLLVTTMSAALVRMALLQREQLERSSWATQADWLALSARERAVAQRAADSAYAGETWLPADSPEGAPIGRVEISISGASADGAASSPIAYITVTVPDDDIDCARVARTWSIPAAETSSEPGPSSVDP